jgi:hypothetical protein
MTTMIILLVMTLGTRMRRLLLHQPFCANATSRAALRSACAAVALRLRRGAAAIAALVAGDGRRASRPRGAASESTRPAEIPHGDREHLNFDRTSSAGDAVDVASGDVLRIEMKAIAEARANRS